MNKEVLTHDDLKIILDKLEDLFESIKYYVILDKLKDAEKTKDVRQSIIRFGYQIEADFESLREKIRN